MRLVLYFVMVLTCFAAIQSDSSVEPQIEKLKQTPFGQTILETIQMQLESENPVQNLVQMLQNIDLQLEAEQRRDDETHERFQNNCDNDQSSLQDVINECTTRSKILKTQLDNLNPQKTQKVSDLNRKNSELKDLQAELEQQSETRKLEQSIYEKTLDDLESSLFAVNEAKKMFNDFLDILLKNKKRFSKGSSFIQESSKEQNVEDTDSDNERNSDFDDIFDDEESPATSLNQISHRLLKLKHNVQEEGVKMMISGLAQLSSNMHGVDPAEEQESLTRKVIGIVNQLATFIQKSRVSEDQAEQARKEAYLTLEQMFTDQIVFTQKEQIALQGAIESLSNQITGASNEKFEVDQKLQGKENQLNDKDQECRNEVLDYESEKAKRDAERDSLAEALDIVTNKLGQLKKQILEKGF